MDRYFQSMFYFYSVFNSPIRILINGNLAENPQIAAWKIREKCSFRDKDSEQKYLRRERLVHDTFQSSGKIKVTIFKAEWLKKSACTL